MTLRRVAYVNPAFTEPFGQSLWVAEDVSLRHCLEPTQQRSAGSASRRLCILHILVPKTQKARADPIRFVPHLVLDVAICGGQPIVSQTQTERNALRRDGLGDVAWAGHPIFSHFSLWISSAMLVAIAYTHHYTHDGGLQAIFQFAPQSDQ